MEKKVMKINAVSTTISVALTAACAATGMAQQIYGTAGSPSATTTLSGKQLPPPDPKFGGEIKERASESKAWWAPRVVPPKGAPNVLLIRTADDGFGAPGTFGGVIPCFAAPKISPAAPFPSRTARSCSRGRLLPPTAPRVW